MTRTLEQEKAARNIAQGVYAIARTTGADPENAKDWVLGFLATRDAEHDRVVVELRAQIEKLNKSDDRGKQAGSIGDIMKCGHNRHWLTYYGDSCQVCLREKAEAAINIMEKSAAEDRTKFLALQSALAAEEGRHTATVQKWHLERKELLDELVKLRQPAGDEEVAKAQADVAKYGDRKYPTGEDRAALCWAAVVLDRALRAKAAVLGERIEKHDKTIDALAEQADRANKADEKIAALEKKLSECRCWKDEHCPLHSVGIAAALALNAESVAQAVVPWWEALKEARAYLPSESEILDYAATNDGVAGPSGVLVRKIERLLSSVPTSPAPTNPPAPDTLNRRTEH